MTNLSPQNPQKSPVADQVLDLSCKKRKLSPLELPKKLPKSLPLPLEGVKCVLDFGEASQLVGNSNFHTSTTGVSSTSHRDDFLNGLSGIFSHQMPTQTLVVNDSSHLPKFDMVKRPKIETASTTPSVKSSSTFDSLSKLSNLVSKVGTSANGSATVIQNSNKPNIFQQYTNNENPDRQALMMTSHNGGESSSNSVSPGRLLNGGGGLNFQDLWWKFVKKEENAEIKRLNEAKQIFTCLQCQASFQTMDQLVKHMETTQHFTNIPKHYRLAKFKELVFNCF